MESYVDRRTSAMPHGLEMVQIHLPVAVTVVEEIDATGRLLVEISSRFPPTLARGGDFSSALSQFKINYAERIYDALKSAL